MKSKILNKARIASAVMLATATMAAGTAQADSLLAPAVFANANGGGLQTYMVFKVRGTGEVNVGVNIINQIFNGLSTNHYYYLRKRAGAMGTAGFADDIDDLYTYRASHGCTVENNRGLTSAWDMTFQSAQGPQNVGGIHPFDLSAPNGYNPTADFFGMMVIDDEENNDADATINEGEMSGFAYIVDPGNGHVLDYKLLNNHRSKESGDFSAGFISKRSIDFAWLPTGFGTFGPTTTATVQNAAENTVWYSAVTGSGMTGAAEQAGGWNEVATFTQAPVAGQSSAQIPTGGETGAYNNDETFSSGPRNLIVNCLGMYDRTDFLTPNQIFDTQFGGWKRMHTNVANTQGGVGAITYRFDDLGSTPMAFGTQPLAGDWTMQVETSGHLGTGPFGNHPNRPY